MDAKDRCQACSSKRGVEKNLEIADQDLLKRVLSDKRFKQLTDIKEDSINLPERAGFIGRNMSLLYPSRLYKTASPFL